MSIALLSTKHYNSIAFNLIDQPRNLAETIMDRVLESSVYGSEEEVNTFTDKHVKQVNQLNYDCFNARYDEDCIVEPDSSYKNLTLEELYEASCSVRYQIEMEHIKEPTEEQKQALKFIEEVINCVARFIADKANGRSDNWSIR